MAVFGLINGESGTLISVLAISQGCGAIVVPFRARRHTDRRPWLWPCIAMQGTGFAGLMVAPSMLPLFWVARGRATGWFTGLLCFTEGYESASDPDNCRSIEGSFDTVIFVE